MSSLSGFRRDAEPKAQTSGRIQDFKVPARTPKGPYDRDRCPAGWDAELWHLTLLFEQAARADGITLRAGRPVIYAEIDALVTQWNMREKAAKGLYRQEVDYCERRKLGRDMADRCWYHYPPGKTAEQEQHRVLTWAEVVEIIMAELWSRIMNEHALDYFRQFFAEYGLAMTKHWRSLRIVREIDEQPKVERPVMRRRNPSGTMTADSKEG